MGNGNAFSKNGSSVQIAKLLISETGNGKQATDLGFFLY